MLTGFLPVNIVLKNNAAFHFIVAVNYKLQTAQTLNSACACITRIAKIRFYNLAISLKLNKINTLPPFKLYPVLSLAAGTFTVAFVVYQIVADFISDNGQCSARQVCDNDFG